MTVPFLACMTVAAAFYHLPPRVLPSIAVVEGGKSGLMHVNPNDTADLGLMQVNTIWVRPLARYAHMRPEVVFVRLRDDPCFSIAAAAAVMPAPTARDSGHGRSPPQRPRCTASQWPRLSFQPDTRRVTRAATRQ